MIFMPNNEMVIITVETRTPLADFRQSVQLNTKKSKRFGNMHQLITRGMMLPINICFGKEIFSS
jgi:hypothetical protein